METGLTRDASNRDDRPIAVVALGGNSLITDSEHQTVSDQYRAISATSRQLAALHAMGYRLVITHGNGPQVGFILLRSELARNVLHDVPLENCVADTQGAIGYQIVQTLGNELRQMHADQPVAALVTQVLVNADDPSFERPEKPIGPFLSRDDAMRHAAADGWVVKEDAGRGWRRVVPSPIPLEIIELDTIRQLLDSGTIVVTLGGGGVPVVRGPDGALQGRDAVIDKDFATSLLARQLGASALVFSTSVERVSLNFNTPKQKGIDLMSVEECRACLEAGHFLSGSMRPKIEAALAFLENGGEKVIITQPQLLSDAMQGLRGTHIVR